MKHSQEAAVELEIGEQASAFVFGVSIFEKISKS